MNKKTPSECEIAYESRTNIDKRQQIGNSKMSTNTLVSNSITEEFLPAELITEILSWLPAKCLARLKLVCKGWYSLIQDPHFIFTHWNRALVAPYRYNVDGGVTETFRNLDYMSNGLLVEQGSESQKYRIRNHATRQIVDLPDPHMDSSEMYLIFVPSTWEFKLVSCYGKQEPAGEFEGCEILTVQSGDLSWRHLKFPYSTLLNKKRLESKSAFSTTGVVHFIRTFIDDESEEVDIEVQSLDLESECFCTSTTVPQGFFSDLTKVSVVDCNRHLSFGNIVEEELNVLVLEDFKKGKWSEKKLVVPLRFLKENQDMKENLEPLWAYPEELGFHWNDELYFYDSKIGEITKKIALHKDDVLVKSTLVRF